MLFDSHTHLQFAGYDEDRDAVIARAKAVGVSMVNVGTDVQSSLFALELAKQYKFDGMYATLGFHPTNIERRHDIQEKKEAYYEEFDKKRFFELAKDDGFSMIGECGLDYFHIEDEALRNREKEIFLDQFEVAVTYKKPLMIHCRPRVGNDAYDDLYKLLKLEVGGLPANPGILHFFVGDNEIAKKFLDLGFYLSFGGAITFKNAEVNRERVRYVPLDRIVLETDAPYVTPEPYRGKRNEPLYVKYVAEILAGIKGLPLSKIETQTFQNTKTVLGI
ncbi:MAG: TatD family hydrolase [Parcubacteria group bacterium]|nr:TatD family hydrolase [Parcubacteria group bacterium]